MSRRRTRGLLRDCQRRRRGHAAGSMVATAKKFSARAEAAIEERALMKLNRLFAKAAPIAAREDAKALKRLHRDIAARIRRAN